MSGIYTVVITACAAALICSIASNFISNSGTKKILTLVLGAFAVCSMLAPIGSAVKNFDPEIEKYQTYDELTATSDEAVRAKLIGETRSQLEQTLNSILEQNGITPNKTEVILSESGEKSIIISQVSIYINQDNMQNTDLITELTMQSFGIVPNIITE